MRAKVTKYRFLAVVLSLCMVFSMFNGVTVFASEEDAKETALCEHHTEHTGECGYVETVEGADCQHEHDDSCKYQAAVPEIPCDKACTDIDEDGVIDHVEGCAYTPAVEEQPCGHQVHDDACGYIEAVPGHPCEFVCEICQQTQEDLTAEDDHDLPQDEDSADDETVGENDQQAQEDSSEADDEPSLDEDTADDETVGEKDQQAAEDSAEEDDAAALDEAEPAAEEEEEEEPVNHAVERLNAQIGKLPASVEGLTWEAIVSNGYYEAAKIALQIMTSGDVHDYELRDEEDFARIEALDKLVYFCNYAAEKEVAYYKNLTADNLKDMYWRDAVEVLFDIYVEGMAHVYPEDRTFLYEYMDNAYGYWGDYADGALDNWADITNQDPYSSFEFNMDDEVEKYAETLSDSIAAFINSQQPYEDLTEDELTEVLTAFQVLFGDYPLYEYVENAYDNDGDEDGFAAYKDALREKLQPLVEYFKPFYDLFVSIQGNYNDNNDIPRFEERDEYKDVFADPTADPERTREVIRELESIRAAFANLPVNVTPKIAYMLECAFSAHYLFENFEYISEAVEELMEEGGSRFDENIYELIQQLLVLDFGDFLPYPEKEYINSTILDSAGKEQKLVSYSNGTTVHHQVTTVTPPVYYAELQGVLDEILAEEPDPDDEAHDAWEQMYNDFLQEYEDELKSHAEDEASVGSYVLNLAVAFGLNYQGNLKLMADGRTLQEGTDYTIGTPVPPARSTDKYVYPIIFENSDSFPKGVELIVTYDTLINAAAWYGSITDKNRSYAYWECTDTDGEILYSQKYDLQESEGMTNLRVEDHDPCSYCVVFGIKIYDYSNLDKRVEGFSGDFVDEDQLEEGTFGDMFDPTTFAPLYLLEGAEYHISGTDYAGNPLERVIVIRDNLVEYTADSAGQPVAAVSAVSTYAAAGRAAGSSSAGQYLVQAMGKDTLMKLLYYRYEHGIVPLETISVAQQSPYYALKMPGAYSQVVPANSNNPSAYANDGKAYVLEPEAYSAGTNAAIPVGDGGGLLLGGLGVGTYTLTMTKAPDGCVLPGNREIHIRLYWADYDGKEIDPADYGWDEEADGEFVPSDHAYTVFCEVIDDGRKTPMYSSEALWFLEEGMPSYAAIMNPTCMVLVYPVGHDRLSLTVQNQVISQTEEEEFTFYIALEEPNLKYFVDSETEKPYNPCTNLTWAVWNDNAKIWTAASFQNARAADNIALTSTDEAGIYKVSLKHGDKIAFTNLLDATKYEITEIKQEDFITVTANGVAEGETGVYDEAVAVVDLDDNGQEVEGKGTQTGVKTDGTLHYASYDKEYHDVVYANNQNGGLTVSNAVTGNAGDTSKEYHFTVTLGDTGINGTYGGMTFANGVATFTLKHGENKSAAGLPAGITYTVKETEANQDGYATTATNAEGAVPAGKTAEVSFVNSKSVDPTPPPTTPPVTTEPPTTPPVTTEPPTTPPVATEPPSTPPVTTEPPTTPPVATEPPTTPPVATEAPTTPPVATETPSPTPSSAVPNAGDSSNIGLWTALLSVSVIGLAIVPIVVAAKRKNA